jgi:hypothetical protein
MNIEAKYRNLTKELEMQNMKTYLIEWEKTYTAIKALKLFKIDENRSLRNFLVALTARENQFSNNQLMSLKKNDTDLMTLIVTFRRYTRMRETDNIKKMIKNHSVFTFASQSSAFSAIFNDQQSDQSDKKPRKKKTCLCDIMHSWDTCYYLMLEKRSSDWTSNLAIQVKVDDALIKDKRLKTRVDEVIKYHKNKTKKQINNETNQKEISQIN